MLQITLLSRFYNLFSRVLSFQQFNKSLRNVLETFSYRFPNFDFSLWL